MKINIKRAFVRGAAVILTAAPLAFHPEAHAGWNDSIRWKAELEADLGGGKHNPFWIASNRQGMASINKNSGFFRLSAFHDLDTARRFTWGAGADLAVGWNQLATFHVQQLYGEIKYRALQVMVGQKEIPGFIDTDISSGSMLFSGNAMPIPQVRVGVFDYADFWGCKGWMSMKAYLAYGAYTDQNFQRHWVGNASKRTKNVLYHSKGAWLKFGDRKRFPLEFEAGAEIVTQFGGSSYNKEQSDSYKWNKLPSGWKDWLKAFFPMSDKNSQIAGESTNVQGNVFGVYDFALSWNKPQWAVTLYYQHYFEDHSQMFFDYPWIDGTWGVRGRLPENRFVSEIMYELMYTKDQSGTVLHDYTEEIPEQVSGRDSYFTNYLYPGVTNWGMSICNPLIISAVYNNPHNLSCESTRVISHHLGFKGKPTSELRYRVMLSWFESWGTYYHNYPEVRHNFSGMLELGWRPSGLRGWEGIFAIAGDTGTLIGNSLGVRLSISKTGWLFGPRNKRK